VTAWAPATYGDRAADFFGAAAPWRRGRRRPTETAPPTSSAPRSR